MNRETFALSQKELQRVAVISRCVKGELACARAAGLLCLSVRQIKRLKKRLREDGEAALAHASRGRPSHRRLPQAVRERIVQLARGTYAGFNDHHLCEKLVECQGISLSRETLRRLLRQQGRGSPRKRRAPAHRQRRRRSAQLAELCCFVHERIVSNDNVVQGEGRRFQIPQQARRFSFAGAKVQIYQALDGRVSLYYRQTRLQHSALPGGDSFMLPLG